MRVEMSEIRWGTIGCGAVAEVKSGPALQRADGSALVAVMGRDAARAEDFARRHGVPRWYSDVDALLADPEVDAVYVATPPGSHVELALRVLSAGKPAYVEKPLARSLAECLHLDDAFAAKKLPLFVAYYRRALPRFVFVKRLLDSRELGDPRFVHYRYARPWDPSKRDGWRLDAERSGGGFFMDIGCHTLDLFDFWLGPLDEVAGLAANVARAYSVEDTVALTFRSASGAVGAASFCFVAHERHDEITLVCDRGTVTCSCFGDEPVRVTQGGATREVSLPNPPHIQQPLVQSMVDELLGRGACPSNGKSAVRTARVMDRVLETFWGDRRGRFWDTR